MIRCILISAAALLSAGVAWAAEPEKVDLRPRFVAGQENRFQVYMHSRQQTQYTDSPRYQLQEYQQGIRLRRRVVEASESGATLEIVYEAATVSLIAGNKMLTFDSEGINPPEPEEVLGASVRNALNRPFTVKVDALGRVLEVSGNEGGSKPASVNLIGDHVLGKALAPMYGLHKEPPSAAVGESWQIERRNPATETGVVTITTTSTLDSVENGRASITLDGSISIELSERAKQGKAKLVSHDIAGEQLWNVDAGVLDRSIYRQEMQLTGEMEVKDIFGKNNRIRQRTADTLLEVRIDRIDEGMNSLPVMAAPAPLEAPPPQEEEPPSRSPAAKTPSAPPGKGEQGPG